MLEVLDWWLVRHPGIPFTKNQIALTVEIFLGPVDVPIEYTPSLETVPSILISSNEVVSVLKRRQNV